MVQRLFSIALFCIITHAFLQGADNKNTLKQERLFKHCIFNEPHAEHPNLRAWRNGLDLKIIAALACVNKQWNNLHEIYVMAPRTALKEELKNDFKIETRTIIFNPDGDFCFRCTHNYKPCCVVSFGGIVSVYTEKCIGTLDNCNILSEERTICNNKGIARKKNIFHAIKEYSSTFIIPKNVLILTYSIGLVYIGNNKEETISLSSLKEFPSLITERFFNLSYHKNFWHYHFEENGVKMQKKNGLYKAFIDKYNNYFEDCFVTLRRMNYLAKKLDSTCTACFNEIIHDDCINDYKELMTLAEQEGFSLKIKKQYANIFARNHTWHETSCAPTNPHYDTICVNAAGEWGIIETSNWKISDIQLFADTTPKNNFKTQEKIEENLKSISPEDRSEDYIHTIKASAIPHKAQWQMSGSIPCTETCEKNEKKITLHLWNSDNRYVPCCLYIKKDESLADSTTHEMNILVTSSVLNGKTYDNYAHKIIVAAKIQPSHDIILLGSKDNRCMSKYNCESIDDFKAGIKRLAEDKTILRDFACRITLTHPDEADQYLQMFKTHAPEIIKRTLYEDLHNPFRPATS